MTVAMELPPASRSVRVYRLLGSANHGAAGARLASLLFDMDGDVDDRRRFFIHPVSGGIFYADGDRLWQGGAGLPTDAERAARSFLEEANRRVATDRELVRMGWTAVVPPDIRVERMGVVTGGAASEPDHALVQFSCHLAVDEIRTARVEGAQVSLRIGRSGRILELATRWRPIAYDLLSAAVDPAADKAARSSASPFAMELPAPASPPTPPAPGRAASLTRPILASDGYDLHDPESAEDQPEYVYMLADENMPQPWLAPFRQTLIGHHGGIVTASAHSLALDVRQRAGSDGTDLVALVEGGSGDMEFQWAYWSPADFIETGLQDIGAEPGARLPPGAWQVALQVRDRVTGQAAQVERLVLGVLAKEPAS